MQRGIRSAGRAPGLHAGCRGFESLIAHRNSFGFRKLRRGRAPAFLECALHCKVDTTITDRHCVLEARRRTDDAPQLTGEKLGETWSYRHESCCVSRIGHWEPNRSSALTRDGRRSVDMQFANERSEAIDVEAHDSSPISGQTTPARKGRWNRIGRGASSQASVQTRPNQETRSIGRFAFASRASTVIKMPWSRK